MKTIRETVRRLPAKRIAAAAVAAPAIGLAAFGTSALAASLSPLPTDGSGNEYYAAGATPSATSTILAPNTTYLVGLCDTASLANTVPDCSTYVQATSDGNGDLTVTLPALAKNGLNVHRFISGHPWTVDCALSFDPDVCSIAFVDHSGPTIADTSVGFYIA